MASPHAAGVGRLPTGADGCRGRPLHPLHIRNNRQAEGDRPHHRWLPHRRDVFHQVRLRPARGRRLLVHGRRRVGDRALVPGVRTAGERCDVRDVRGGAGLAGEGPHVGHLRATRRDDLLHRAHRDPRLHEVGRRVAGTPRPLSLAIVRERGRADQSRSVDVVPRTHRPQALPDRRHLVADGDRIDRHLAAARDHVDQARLGDAPAPRLLRRTGGRLGQPDRAWAVGS